MWRSYLPNGGEVDYDVGQKFMITETRLALVSPTPQYGFESCDYDVGSNDTGLWKRLDAGSCRWFPGHLWHGVWKSQCRLWDYSSAELLLRRHVARNGDTTWFLIQREYVTSVLTTLVLDPDGHTNILSYNGQQPAFVSDQCLRPERPFKYDSNGNLTNIVDAAGMSSS